MAALSDLAPADDEAAAALLGAVGDNAGLLELGDVTARYIDQVGTVAADGSWTGVVEMTWRFGDIDPSPARADVLVSFAPDGDELGITGFGADSTVDTGSYAAVAPRPARRGVDPRGSRARRGHPRRGRGRGPTGVTRNRCRAPCAP